MEVKTYILILFLITSCSHFGRKQNKATAPISNTISSSMRKNIAFTRKMFDYLQFEYSELETSITKKCITDHFTIETRKLHEKLINDPKVTTQIELGICYQLAGEFSKALYFYDNALAKITKKQSRLRATVYNNLGIMYGKRNFFDKSHNYFKKAAKERPRDFITTYNTALLLSATGQYLQSTNLINRFKGSFEEEMQLTKILGINYLSTNNLILLKSKAIDKLDDTFSEKAFLMAILSYFENGKSKIALETMENIENIGPIYLDIYNNFLDKLKVEIKRNESEKNNTSIRGSG